jgi:hypothetical protein
VFDVFGRRPSFSSALRGKPSSRASFDCIDAFDNEFGRFRGKPLAFERKYRFGLRRALFVNE